MQGLHQAALLQMHYDWGKDKKERNIALFVSGMTSIVQLISFFRVWVSEYKVQSNHFILHTDTIVFTPFVLSPDFWSTFLNNLDIIIEQKEKEVYLGKIIHKWVYIIGGE